MIGALAALLLLAAPYERAPLDAADFDWLERPTAEEIGRFFPTTTARPVERLVVVECTVGPAGRLEQCRVFKAPETDNGEMRATLRLASRFRMTARTRSGESTFGRKVRVPVRWMPPD